ncbi:hypothetical protein [Pelagicoccus mobilis]|uniref:YARHG domain-containing protein n=1 Tax=Pelagicoccus mobilis TaxID=415221 RepID=A0A934S0W2_9BACT|nr:hypothetical protein [Pelagicoccus mobilis]MBK1879135.1 hypothetical protein [Pelagicoccus mobilis]
MYSRPIVSCLAAFWLISGLSAAAQAPNYEFFGSHEEVLIRLEAPLTSLKKQRGDDLEWLEGVVRWEDEAGVAQSTDVKIRARGKYRRLRSTCHFPPYWVNFKKSQVKGTLFDGLDKVKIVSHCRDGFSSFENYIYKEYLCYRTYNIITDRSFRVRLARIEYLDTERKKEKVDEHVAFFIEHNDSLGERMDATMFEGRHVLPSKVSHEDLCRAELFQFFVGNTDFSFFTGEEECCHNGKVFIPNGKDDEYIPVPYDFDLSGIVNTPYAIVDPHFPNLSVRDRHYRGMGVSRETLQDTLIHYDRKKDEIYDLWQNSGLLEGADLKGAIRYIDEFYDFIRTKKKRKREIIQKLRSFEVMERAILEDIEKEKQEAEQ